MNVFNKVAYPLQNMKMPKAEIAKRVAKTLKFVQLEGFEKRPATRLSGGQQQRVALARALVAEPKVILFDEPLSNLDAKLREETRKELRMFLSELGITAIYVTHDRVEALALSDMIGVMNAGNIVELGTPKKIYFDADHQFVADFIGRANLLPAKITRQTEEHTIVSTSIGEIACQRRSFEPSAELTLCIRPEFSISVSRLPHRRTGSSVPWNRWSSWARCMRARSAWAMSSSWRRWIRDNAQGGGPGHLRHETGALSPGFPLRGTPCNVAIAN
jgi:iron(III) transport system ATP-binding protein